MVIFVPSSTPCSGIAPAAAGSLPAGLLPAVVEAGRDAPVVAPGDVPGAHPAATRTPMMAKAGNLRR